MSSEILHPRVYNAPIGVLTLMRLNDFRLAGRFLLKSPVLTLVTVSALAIGIGANVTVFCFVNTVLLRPLDASEPEHLVRVDSGDTEPLSVVEFEDYLHYRDRNLSLASLAMFHWGGLKPVQTGAAADMLHVMPVSGNYLSTLGVSAALGRTLRPEDDLPGSPGVVMLSDVCWRRYFAADPNVIGSTVRIRSIPLTVVGVAPQSFRGTISPVIPQFYVPWNATLGLGNPKVGLLIGRRKPGVVARQARADLSRIATQLSLERRRPISIAVHSATSAAPGFIRGMTVMAILFMSVVGLVLLIACDNIALLLLARSAARRREMGIRLALGATRGQLIQQLLAEGLLLATLGGLAAAAVALTAVRLLSRIHLPVPMPIALAFDFDWRVALFTAGISVAATLLFALLPAMQSSKTDVLSALKEGGMTAGPGGMRANFTLIALQVAISTVLLITAAVLVGSLTALKPYQRGFAADGILMATLNLSEYSPEKATALQEAILSKLESAPGIVSATLADYVPLTNNRPLPAMKMRSESFTDIPDNITDTQRVFASGISRGYFRTMEIQFIEGRDFDNRDVAGAVAVGIANETLAARFWPGEYAIGKRLRAPDGSWVEVVGIVRDGKYESMDESPKSFLYRPAAQAYNPTATLLIKTARTPLSALSLVRAKVSEVDPHLLAYNLNSLEDRIGLNLLPNRTAAFLAGFLGLLALALGTVGIYGTMSFLGQQRRREIAIRMALGAPRRSVVGLITGQGMLWTLGGQVLGVGLSIGVIKLLKALLSGIANPEPLAFAGVLALLSGAALLACWLPASHATKVDPILALRQD